MGEGTLGTHATGDDLLPGYPGSRAHAVRWLGWLAYRMNGSPDLEWWEIPAWLPGGQLRLVRRAAACLLVAASAGLAYALDPRAAILPGIVIVLGLWFVYHERSSGPEHVHPGTAAHLPAEMAGP